MNFTVEYSGPAKRVLQSIRDVRIRRELFERAEALAVSPELQGKALGRYLAGYRSVRAAGKRYRIVYRIEESRVIVFVVFVGLRREGDRTDVYEQTKQLALKGRIDPE